MLFKVSHDKDIFELNPEMQAIVEFAKLTPRQMQAVALIADYNSPFRSLPEKARREKACETAGYKSEVTGRLDRNGRAVVLGEVASMERAIKKYREIQYDERKAMLEAVDAQIQEALSLMTMDKREACKVKKTISRKDGSSTTEEYIDSVEAMKLAEAAVKLGSRLKDLKETKDALMSDISKNETKVDTITYTSADIDINDPNSTDKSVLDLFMEKQIFTNEAQ
jgi:hypothetical protein